MIKNLVLSGGAFNAFAFLGCIQLLEERKLVKKLDTIIGSSAGAILGFCLALGYKAAEIYDIILQESHSSTPNHEAAQDIISLEAILSIGNNYGIDDGSRIEMIARKILFRKLQVEDTTFLEFAKKSGTNLIITGTNITKQKTEYFSVETTPAMSVITAIRITTSVPIVFHPVRFQDSLYIDGGIFNNFPMEQIANRDKFHEMNTLGLMIDMNLPEIKTFWDYLNSIIHGVLGRQYVANEKLLKLPNVCQINLDIDRSITWNLLQLKVDKSQLDMYVIVGKETLDAFLKKSPFTKH
jgi:patatin-like phospholipase/acyl hydrolase